MGPKLPGPPTCVHTGTAVPVCAVQLNELQGNHVSLNLLPHITFHKARQAETLKYFALQ
jgi:hypothetical protein